MKFTKLILPAALALVAMVLTMPEVKAQTTAPIYYADGGATNANNYVAAASTNTYSVACSEVENLPCEFTFKCTASSTDPLMIHGYRSLNSSTYETTPFYQQWVTPTGTTPFTIVTNLDTKGAATIQFKIGNTNATTPGYTNLLFVVRPKAPKRAVFNTSR